MGRAQSLQLLAAHGGAEFQPAAFPVHPAQETADGVAALLDRQLGLMEVEKPDAIEIYLDRGVGRIAGEP